MGKLVHSKACQRRGVNLIQDKRGKVDIESALDRAYKKYDNLREKGASEEISSGSESEKEVVWPEWKTGLEEGQTQVWEEYD